MEVIKLLFAMCIIITLKLAFKPALLTGRIRQQSWCVHDPAQMAAGRPDFPCTPDFCPQTSGHYSSMKRGRSGKVWIQSDWKRTGLRLRRWNTDKWIKINRIFSPYHLPNSPRHPASGLPPRVDSDAVTLHSECHTTAANQQKHRTSAPDTGGKKKNSYIWLQSRSKAIGIVLNSSTYPNPIPAVSNIDLVHKYQTDKCGEVDHVQLLDATWQSQIIIDPPPPGCELHMQAFTETEV